MKFPRSSGILLHPTCLPGPYGIGELSESAYAFVDFMVESGQSWWQVMPLGPTGYGDSPYQSFSAFAGNPLLLNMAWLASDGLLPDGALQNVPDFPSDRVDYGEVQNWKLPLLEDIYLRFHERASYDEKGRFWHFIDSNRHWLEDFTLFMALKQHFKQPWNKWPVDIRMRTEQAVDQWSGKLSQQIATQRLLQYLFSKQWTTLKQYANQHGISIIGDLPIFVAYDSADVWANRELFFLDEEGNATVVAGVPPDYFSETGQRWGNPLYRWQQMSRQGFDWWLARLRTSFEMFDAIRLDHFRGFEAYWEIQAEEPTAESGRWIKVPGKELFETVRKELGDVPIIAENLGLITAEVEALRKAFEFPGMRVLQFAFDGDPTNTHLPHNFRLNSVVYTGTHDNNTTRGWWEDCSEQAQAQILAYLGLDQCSAEEIVAHIIQQAMRSVAAVAIFPIQDILKLADDARMNTPGAPSGNWTWRLSEITDRENVTIWLQKLTKQYGRLPEARIEPTE